MTSRCRAIGLIAAALTLARWAAAEPPAGYHLEWADEFDDTELKQTEWAYRTDAKHWSTQRPENVAVHDGCLWLALRKEDAGGKAYTGAGIISQRTFRYGYFEARFKIPAGKGWHTSFWLQRYDGQGGTSTTAARQEIDVCENDSVNPRRYGANLHRWNPAPHRAYGPKSVATPDLAAGFHTWGCEFTPDKVTYYFDGESVWTTVPEGLEVGDQNVWLTSIASPNGGTDRVDDAVLPAYAVFDYVRVYTKAAVTKVRPSGEAAGPDLAVSLRPSPATAKFADPDFYIWCGSPIQSPDGQWHLFYSRWPRRLGHYAWVTHSEIAHATAPSPTGPWQHHDVALPARGAQYWDGLCTHNPTIHYFNGRYYLYYMGDTGDGVAMPTLNWTHRNNQRIGVAVAPSPNGPWQRSEKPLIAPTPGSYDALCVANPTVTQRPDGKYLMIYKAVGAKNPLPFGGPVVHLAAISDEPTGPFVKQPDPVFVKEGVPFAAEDPFIWRGRDRYWAIVKDNAGFFTGAGKSLALFESNDGLHWQLAAHPLVSTPHVRWLSDGTDQPLNSLERPQLAFSHGRPVALLCAADEDTHRTWSYNVGLPLADVSPVFCEPTPGNSGSRPTIEPFRDGDRWTVVGDSITEGGWYARWIELFYLTRYPQLQLTVTNAGVSGDTAAGALARYAWDIAPTRPTVATVMFGMNDIGRQYYAPDQYGAEVDRMRARRLTDYVAHEEELLLQLRRDGCRVIWIVPTIFEQTAVLPKPNLPGANDALRQAALTLRDFAAAQGIPVIDFQTPMLSVNARLQPRDPSFSIVGPDRVHPTPAHHLALAYWFLKAQEVRPDVATIEVNIGGGSPSAVPRFCQMEQLHADAGRVSFQFVPTALPLPLGGEFAEVERLLPWHADLDREILRVTGLRAGSYQVVMDGEEIGRATAEDLAGGWDLAAVATPETRQAGNVLELCRQKWRLVETNLRLIARVEHQALPPHATRPDATAVEPRLAAWVAADPNYRAGRERSVATYRSVRPREAAVRAEVSALEQRIRAAAQPVRHRVEIRSVAAGTP